MYIHRYWVMCIHLAGASSVGYLGARCSDEGQLEDLQYTYQTNPDCKVIKTAVTLDEVQNFGYAKGWTMLDFRCC